MKGKITIADNGTVTVPSEVRMTIAEIADLFGIFYQTAKINIRAIEKSGVAEGDYTAGGMVEGMKVYPDYYGLEMIVALAFRVRSARAKVFRKWVITRSLKTCGQPIFLNLNSSAFIN